MHDIVVSTFIFRCLILPTKSTQSGKPNILKQFPTVVSYLDYPQQLFPTLNILNVITEESQAPFNTATYSPAPMGKIELT